MKYEVSTLVSKGNGGYTTTKYTVYTEEINKHHLLQEQETMSTLELITSPGYIYLMSLILVPTTVVAVLLIKLIRKK